MGIGDRQPPARLVSDGAAGKGIVASLVDMGGRMRLIVQDIDCIEPLFDMPKLPVARVMWKPMPELLIGVKCWVLAGGAHHSVLCTQADAQMLSDWADMMDLEFVHITMDTTYEQLRERLFLSDLVWKLR